MFHVDILAGALSRQQQISERRSLAGRRRLAVLCIVAAAIQFADGAARADGAQPAPATSEPSIYTAPLHCRRWTDDCVNCVRDDNGTAMCSNIGPACQPRAIRCLQDDPPSPETKPTPKTPPDSSGQHPR